MTPVGGRKEKTVKKQPELQLFGYPVWWHRHGVKMQVKQLDPRNRCLVVAGSVARVRITPRSVTVDEGWFVDWEIILSQQERVRGRVNLRGDALSSAFGLSEQPLRLGDGWLIERFGADVARQREYIRWGDYLNIPCPGTGHDGNPNVSIFLDSGIKGAVRTLLANQPEPCFSPFRAFETH